MTTTNIELLDDYMQLNRPPVHIFDIKDVFCIDLTIEFIGIVHDKKYWDTCNLPLIFGSTADTMVVDFLEGDRGHIERELLSVLEFTSHRGNVGGKLILIRVDDFLHPDDRAKLIRKIYTFYDTIPTPTGYIDIIYAYDPTNLVSVDFVNYHKSIIAYHGLPRFHTPNSLQAYFDDMIPDMTSTEHRLMTL